MKTFQVYDKPMCCSTGVCEPQVDPVLPRFAADLASHEVPRSSHSQPVLYRERGRWQNLVGVRRGDSTC